MEDFQDAFRALFERIGVDGAQLVLFEDSFKNLKTAKSLGMRTVFVHSMTATEEGVKEEDHV
jgi:HAD superfamily hydrolase (TIGR01509 family)